MAPAVIEESGSAKATSDRLAQIRGTTGLKAVPVPGSPWHILAVYPSWVEPWRVSSGEAPPMPLRAVAQASDGLVSALKDWDSFGEGDPVFTQAKRLMSAWEAYEAEARPAAGEVLVHDSTRDGAAADGAAAVTSSRATRKVYPRIPRPGLESKVWMGGSFVGQFCEHRPEREPCRCGCQVQLAPLLALTSVPALRVVSAQAIRSSRTRSSRGTTRAPRCLRSQPACAMLPHWHASKAFVSARHAWRTRRHTWQRRQPLPLAVSHSRSPGSAPGFWACRPASTSWCQP